MIKNNFDYLKFLNVPQINDNLWESGFFCADYNTNKGFLSKPLTKLGFKAEDMLDGKYLGKIHPHDILTYQNMVDRLHSGLDDVFHFEYRLMDKEGNWNWLLTQAFVIKRNKDRTVHKIIGIDRDINSQKNVESYYHLELKESKIQLDLINSIRLFNEKPDQLGNILNKLKHVVDFVNCGIYIKNRTLKKLYQFTAEKSIIRSNLRKIYKSLEKSFNPIIIDDPEICSPYSSILAIPLHINDKIFGCVILYHSLSRFYKGKDIVPLKGFLDFLSLQINNYISEKNDLEKINKIHKEEHLNISRELHDGIAQNLACCRIITEQLTTPEYKKTVGDNEILNLHNIITNTLKEVRILSEGIRITSETRDLNSLIETYCNKLNKYFVIKISFETHCKRNFHVLPEISENLLRIIQEGISNAQRHSNANKVVLSISCDINQVIFKLKDNGKKPVSFEEGMGMKGIRERARILNGKVDWEYDNGTVLRLILADDIFKRDFYEYPAY